MKNLYTKLKNIGRHHNAQSIFDYNENASHRLKREIYPVLPQIYFLLHIKNQKYFQKIYEKFSYLLNDFIFFEAIILIPQYFPYYDNDYDYLIKSSLKLVWGSDDAVENLFMYSVKIPPQDSKEFLTILRLAIKYNNNYLLTRIFSKFNNKPDSAFSVSKEYVIQHGFLLFFVLQTRYVDINKLFPDAQNDTNLQSELKIINKTARLDIKFVNSILRYNLANEDLFTRLMSKITNNPIKDSLEFINEDIDNYPEQILSHPSFVDYVIKSLNNGKISPIKLYQTLLKVNQYYRPALGFLDFRQRKIAKILKDCSSNVPEIKVNEIVKPQQLPNNTPKGKTCLLNFF